MLKFKHSGNFGDVLYALPTIKRACELRGEKAVIMLHLNQSLVANAPGYVHPLGNVMLNKYMFDMGKPLLMAQEYIQDVIEYKGQSVDYDLDTFRMMKLNLSADNISHWYWAAYPELTCESLSDPTIDADPWSGEYSNKVIIVNRTERYLNNNLDYRVLGQDGHSIHFVGTEKEYSIFKHQVPSAWHWKPDNFLDLAYGIQTCSLFIGNQSMCFAIAEQMKTPRALEVARQCPNVIPEGGSFHKIYNQQNLEYVLSTLKQPTKQGKTQSNGST